MQWLYGAAPSCCWLNAMIVLVSSQLLPVECAGGGGGGGGGQMLVAARRGLCPGRRPAVNTSE